MDDDNYTSTISKGSSPVTITVKCVAHQLSLNFIADFEQDFPVFRIFHERQKSIVYISCKK